MIKVIEGDTCPSLWLNACNHLMSIAGPESRTDYNVILHLKHPVKNFSHQELKIRDEVDKFLRNHGARNLDTVAGTIFPLSYYVAAHQNSSGVFDDYPKMMKKIIKGWGSYAYRMVRRLDESGTEYNPLARIIEKINTKPTHGKCLEIGLLPFDADIQLYDPRKDRNRYYGGQCLSHISIKVLQSKKINLTAIYRNHYYIERLLGNLIGLSQLLSFVAKETGMEVGELVIHSTAAEIDTGDWTLKDVQDLIKRVS